MYKPMETVSTIIHINQCSNFFLASIHVAIILKDVVNESQKGIGESVNSFKIFDMIVKRTRNTSNIFIQSFTEVLLI